MIPSNDDVVVQIARLLRAQRAARDKQVERSDLFPFKRSLVASLATKLNDKEMAKFLVYLLTVRYDTLTEELQDALPQKLAAVAREVLSSEDLTDEDKFTIADAATQVFSLDKAVEHPLTRDVPTGVVPISSGEQS